MAYTTINKSTDYFNTKLYTGNSSTNNITGVGFQPDWVWMKNRGALDSHYLYDAVRGVTKNIYSNLTNAEGTASNGLTAFGTDGFTLGNEGDINGNGNNYVSWNWKANGAGSSNTDGSITSTVSVNTTAGFSIVKYAGSNSNVTVGHGLGVAPKMILIKNLSSATSWTVYHESVGNDKRLVLNTEGAQEGTNQFSFGTSPTSSVFALGGGYGDVCTSGANYIAYCFAEKQGFSKFNSYSGAGSNLPFIYTGFKPAFVMIKRSDVSDNWNIFDNKRNEFNLTDKRIYANANNAEATASTVSLDFLSNGFKLRGTDSNINNSSGTYIYMCFGQSIVGSNNIPATAR